MLWLVGYAMVFPQSGLQKIATTGNITAYILQAKEYNI